MSENVHCVTKVMLDVQEIFFILKAFSSAFNSSNPLLWGFDYFVVNQSLQPMADAAK